VEILVIGGVFMKLHEKIKSLRVKKGLSQAEMASKIGLSHGHITRLESGKFNPSTEVLKKIADLFDVSTDFMLDDSTNNEYDIDVKNKPLAEKIKLISSLDEKQQEAVITIIDSMVKEKKMKEVLTHSVDH
jgi:transcriptional regulator with XRE-family HTH domain